MHHRREHFLVLSRAIFLSGRLINARPERICLNCLGHCGIFVLQFIIRIEPARAGAKKRNDIYYGGNVICTSGGAPCLHHGGPQNKSKANRCVGNKNGYLDFSYNSLSKVHVRAAPGARLNELHRCDMTGHRERARARAPSRTHLKSPAPS